MAGRLVEVRLRVPALGMEVTERDITVLEKLLGSDTIKEAVEKAVGDSHDKLAERVSKLNSYKTLWVVDRSVSPPRIILNEENVEEVISKYRKLKKLAVEIAEILTGEGRQ